MKPIFKLALTAALALPLTAAGPLKTTAVTTHDTVDFTGGVIRLATVYGQVNVEPWDQPRVQVTVTRTSFTHNRQYLERIQVKVSRAANGDVEVTPTLPGRNWFLRTFHGLGDFNLDYRIQAPPSAKLAIRQKIGDVIVYGMTGDIDASTRYGDVVVQVPSPNAAVKAKADIGSVFDELPPHPASPAQQLHLHALIGGDTIQTTTDPAPPPSAAPPTR